MMTRYALPLVETWTSRELADEVQLRGIVPSISRSHVSRLLQAVVIQTTIDETRCAEDFASHIRRTIAIEPHAQWIFVMDNLNTHSGEPIVRLVAELLGIDQAALEWDVHQKTNTDPTPPTPSNVARKTTKYED